MAPFLAGHRSRAAWYRTIHVTKQQLYDWLAQAELIPLDQASARTAGDDYGARHQRAQESCVAAEQIDFADLDAEPAILLGERHRRASGRNRLTAAPVFIVVKWCSTRPRRPGPARSSLEAWAPWLGVRATATTAASPATATQSLLNFMTLP